MFYVILFARAVYVLAGLLLACAAYWCWGLIIVLIRWTVATGGLETYTVGKLFVAAAITLLIFAAYGLGLVRLLRTTVRRGVPAEVF